MNRMSISMKKVGILGGTFDPPHTGHLIVANIIREELNLDEIWFIPTFDSPHKNTVATNSNHRYEMTKRAIYNNDYFKLIDWELKQSTKSYTIHTMTYFKEQNPKTDFSNIIGEELNLDEIWFIPTFDSPHKNTVATNSNHRYEMTKRAIYNNDYFKLIDWELKQSTKSYTIHTMTYFKEQNPKTDFYFIIGADMVEYLPYWNSIDDLLELVTFVGVNREGYSLESDYPI